MEIIEKRAARLSGKKTSTNAEHAHELQGIEDSIL